MVIYLAYSSSAGASLFEPFECISNVLHWNWNSVTEFIALVGFRMLFNSHRWTVCWNSVNLLSNWNIFQSVSGLPFLHNTEVKNETKKTFLFKAFLTNSFSLGEKFLLRVLSDVQTLNFTKFLARSSYYLLRDSWQEVRTDRSWWTSPTGDHKCRS